MREVRNPLVASAHSKQQRGLLQVRVMSMMCACDPGDVEDKYLSASE